MKKKLTTCLLLCMLITMSFAQTVSITGNQFTVNGKPIWFNGINTPWNNWADLGGNFVPSWWRSEFQRYVDNKINLARVWIHCSGTNSPTTNTDGSVTGASAAFWSNMDSLVALAKSKKVYIMPSLWSFDMVKNSNQSTYQRYRNLISSQVNIQRYIDNFLIPLVKRYNNEPYVLGWEICNEPEWMFKNSENGPMTKQNVQLLHAMCAAAIHKNCTKPVTTGSASVKWNSPLYDNSGDDAGNVWGNTALQSVYNDPQAFLDFYQIHWYPWMTQWYYSPFQKTTAYYLIDDRPVLVGETQGLDNCDAYVCQTLVQVYENSYLNGFDGVCGWKTPQNDGYGTFENIAVASNAFYGNHADLVYPGNAQTVAVTGVTVVPLSLAINVNDATQLTATISPANATNKTVTWSTSNAAIATVSTTGLVTAKAAGTASITVTTQDGNKTASSAITVTPVSVTGVVITPASVTINVNDTAQLTASIAPSNATNKTVTWSTSNASIATVSTTGLVTAKAAGNASITVTTQDGSKTATSTITVTNINVPVTSIALTPVSVAVAVNNTTQLTATISPSNATNKTVTWSTSNAAIATVNTTGLVTGKGAGTATITATTQDGNKTATSTVTVTAPSTNCTFGAPLAAGLPTTSVSYNKVYVLGTGGPSLANVTNFTMNWNLSLNGLWQLSFNTNNGIPTWWLDLRTVSSWKFNQAQPEITFTNSGFPGLDGSYWATLDGSNIAFVSKSGGFTIYFSNASTAPVCNTAATTLAARQLTESGNKELEIASYPNPFTSSVSLHIANPELVERISIADQLGNEILNLKKNDIHSDITFGEDFSKGMYFLKICTTNRSQVVKLIKQ